MLFGERGNDTIYGNNGNDVLKGGAGSDLLFDESDFGEKLVYETEDDITTLYDTESDFAVNFDCRAKCQSNESRYAR